MKFNIIRKKASSYKELSIEKVELNNITTLFDLLYEVSMYEYTKQNKKDISFYLKEELKNHAKEGKIMFKKYNEETQSFKKAFETILQDFKDGIFRVYLNEVECTTLEETLTLKEDNNLVFIKLVMLSGRLW